MASFFRRLLGGAEPVPLFDAERDASAFLATLPPCSQYVVIASPRYSGNYRGEVIGEAAAMLSFVERLTASTMGGSETSQMARKALPQWLRAASKDDGRTSYMPAPFVATLDSYVMNCILYGRARVHCPECGGEVDHVDQQQRNEKTLGPWSEWTDSWRCPRGHLLYTEDQEIHFVRSKST